MVFVNAVGVGVLSLFPLFSHGLVVRGHVFTDQHDIPNSILHGGIGQQDGVSSSRISHDSSIPSTTSSRQASYTSLGSGSPSQPKFTDLAPWPTDGNAVTVFPGPTATSTDESIVYVTYDTTPTDESLVYATYYTDSTGLITAAPALPSNYPQGIGGAVTQFGFYGNTTFRTDCFCSDWPCWGLCTSYSRECYQMWSSYSGIKSLHQASKEFESGQSLIPEYSTSTATATTYYSYGTTVWTVDNEVGTYLLSSSPTLTFPETTSVITVYSTSQYPFSLPTPHCSVDCPYPSIVPTSNGCAECTIYGVTIQLLYWPEATTSESSFAQPTAVPNVTLNAHNVTKTSVAPVTAVVDGVTITSPDVAMSFRSAFAINICGQTVGSVLGGTVLPLAPSEISSYRMSYNPLAISNGKPGLATTYPLVPLSGATPATFTIGTSIISVNVPVNPTHLPSQVLPVNFRDFVWPYPPSAYNNQTRCLMNAWDCEYIVSDQFNPVLQIPTQVRSFEPAWSTCSLDWEGVFDPPSALTMQTAVDQATLPSIETTVASKVQASTPTPDSQYSTVLAPDNPQGSEPNLGSPTQTGTPLPDQIHPNPFLGQPPARITTYPGHTQAIFTSESKTFTVDDPSTTMVTTSGRTEIIIPSGTQTFTITMPTEDLSSPNPIVFITSPGRTEAVYTSGTATYTITNPAYNPQVSFATFFFQTGVITSSGQKEVIFTQGTDTITLTEQSGSNADPIALLIASGQTQVVYVSGSETYTSTVYGQASFTAVSTYTTLGQTEEVFQQGTELVTVTEPNGITISPITIYTLSGTRRLVVASGSDIMTIAETPEASPLTTTFAPGAMSAHGLAQSGSVTTTSNGVSLKLRQSNRVLIVGSMFVILAIFEWAIR